MTELLVPWGPFLQSDCRIQLISTVYAAVLPCCHQQSYSGPRFGHPIPIPHGSELPHPPHMIGEVLDSRVCLQP